ncbi:succinate dehydrogenase/fumarate reductase iron-sulfur subunit [Thalassoglobus sp.]|uniref:succinate dehydrogenase/fumarate reductase iron-sulfur subunit n=1 Tax=Thalassoglobus sp. TaxID=2795869 RepID=UPI003AA7FAAC
MSDSDYNMTLTLRVWRQDNSEARGKFVDYKVNRISPHMSFLEMLDVLNEQLIAQGEEPVAFDHDCREGICGSCGVMINGQAHGPDNETTTCQLHMRRFQDGQKVVVEPWRANAFPVIKDLVVDRTAFDRIMEAGGYVSVNTGQAQDGNCLPISKQDQESALDAAVCIGCGACVASCKNASAMLFTSAKVSHLAQLPQGDPERPQRVLNMVAQMDAEGFGGCSNTYECEAACPAGVTVEHIARLNREYIKASFCSSAQPTIKANAE